MREIKFRAWHLKYKKFYYNLYWMRLDMKGSWLIEAWYRNPIEDKECLLKFETNILMQYTGLKDKNGKEIYEGDILGIPYIDPMGQAEEKWSYKAKVFYDFGCYWLDYEDKIIFQVPRELLNWVDRKDGKYISNFGIPTIYKNKLHNSIEVIGNIYENPELLK